MEDTAWERLAEEKDVPDWTIAPADAVRWEGRKWWNLNGQYWDNVHEEWYTPCKDTSTIKSEWTASHYDNYYQLTPKDIEAGKVKIDAYFVNKLWKLNQKDDTGGLFHSLKTIARFGEKNPIERELKALYNQTKRMAELYGVELE